MSESYELARLEAVVGADNIVRGDDLRSFSSDYLGLVEQAALAAVLPDSTDQVSAIMKICREAGIAVVPQGGNTGLVAGSVPLSAAGPAIVLSLRRMNRVREISPADLSMVVEAGAVLKDVQDAAEAQGRTFPLSLGAEGSCTIGGNIATNAGGHRVVRYGSARDLLLGVEAVLADGTVVSRLRALRKDNTGYDLRHLLCGSEGTLAVITAVALRLVPQIRTRATALFAMASLDAARDAFLKAIDSVGEFVLAYELVPSVAFELIAAEFPHINLPEVGEAPYFLLVEMATASPYVDIEAILGHHAEDLMAEGLASNGVIAASEAQRQHLWQLREAMVQAQTRHGSTVKHDISVSVSRTPELIRRASEAALAIRPDAIIMAFGHLGDGNIHFNVSLRGVEPDFVGVTGPLINAAVYTEIEVLKGSISAEHGIGSLRRKALLANRAPEDVEIMRKIKLALDPDWTLNPDSIFIR